MIATSFAPAKINLYLHVAAARADGFHPLDSLVVFADVGDVVSATSADGLTLGLSGPFAEGLSEESDNLVLRAARQFAATAGVAPRAALHLEKRLPIASGIGGGSADAAAALRVLNALWRVNASTEDLQTVGRGLGADVPVCVRSATRRMQGAGEMLSAADAPTFDAVLVNPRAAVSTAQVFRVFDTEGRAGALDEPGPSPFARSAAITWLAGLRNDLEPAARQVAPVVAEAFALMATLAPPGALVRMSGSGATCFVLMESAEAADAMARSVAAVQPGWWVQTTRLGKVDVGVVGG